MTPLSPLTRKSHQRGAPLTYTDATIVNKMYGCGITAAATPCNKIPAPADTVPPVADWLNPQQQQMVAAAFERDQMLQHQKPHAATVISPNQSHWMNTSREMQNLIISNDFIVCVVSLVALK